MRDGTSGTLGKMESTREMWEYLRSMYELPNNTQQAHTLQALVNYKMVDEQPIAKFITT